MLPKGKRLPVLIGLGLILGLRFFTAFTRALGAPYFAFDLLALDGDPNLTVSRIAAAQKVHASCIDRMIRLAFRAPSIVRGVPNGSAPADLTA